jgi:hypothetical protein
MQHVIHQHLECIRDVAQPEHHDQELEVVVVHTEHCLGDVVRVHQHLLIVTAEVKLGEEVCPLELIQQLIDYRDGELVFYRPSIEGAVVNAEPPSLVFLAVEQHQHIEG